MEIFSTGQLEIAQSVLIGLFCVAIVSSMIDTLAGGGGLITIPALMIAGLPPFHVLGTNKLQSCVGTGTATFLMLRKKRLRWRDIKLLMLSAFIGSVIGTLAIQLFNPDALKFIIPAVLFVIVIYFVFNKTPEVASENPRMSLRKYLLTAVPGVGFYDGFLGPGTGSFFSLSGVVCRGKDLINATAEAKSMNFATNVASLCVFALLAQVNWKVGFLMMGGQVIGASIGAHLLFKVSAKLLRGLVVVMCLAMLAKYCSDYWFAGV